MIDKNIINRLSFIKYLYELAFEQSNKSEPFSAPSILTFHDAVEMFLILASEYKKVKESPNFMAYWKTLPELTQKESMNKFNKARNILKHQGIMSSTISIELFRASVTNFFEENTSLIFDINFNEVSLIDLINYTDTKNSLKEAEKLMTEGNLEESLDKTAVAFSQLIRDYEQSKEDIFGRSPFFFGKKLPSTTNLRKQGKELSDFMQKTKESIESIQYALKVISLGFDYRKYVKFNLLTPNIQWALSGDYTSYRNQALKEIPTIDDVSFCINFVIECAINLQNI